jgi:hypothetical protein
LRDLVRFFLSPEAAVFLLASFFSAGALEAGALEAGFFSAAAFGAISKVGGVWKMGWLMEVGEVEWVE